MQPKARQWQKPFLLGLPFLLLPSTALVFVCAAQIAGKEVGYLCGFGFYWLIWCILIPLLVSGKRGFARLLTDRRPLFTRSNALIALLWSIITVVAAILYGADFLQASPALMLSALLMATINGVCEELLWRGVYVQVFPADWRFAVLYPAVGFAVWHFVPQLVFPGDNRTGFVISTLFLGLAYGVIAYRTGSAKWTAFSHSLNGLFALAAPMGQIILTLLR